VNDPDWKARFVRDFLSPFFTDLWGCLVGIVLVVMLVFVVLWITSSFG
jgi:hypothetical protein